MSGYRLLVEAHQDIEDIWDYIAEDSMAAADRVVARIYDAIELLPEMPRLGRPRPEWTNKPVRFLVVDNYHVVYVPASRPIVVLAILHGARDIPTILEKR